MATSSMRETFASSGRVGQDLLAVDWSTHPLGDPDTWPLSLGNAVRIMLSSKFSMWMAWGPDLTFFCNDAYRRDTLGAKYPWALGRSAREVWSEIWPDIGPRIERVMETGEATWDEALQLFLERSGYLEETYHTFSYSPLTDDVGAINGMLCVVAEVTEERVNERRMSTLRHLGIRVSAAESVADAVAAGCDHLASNNVSLPWVAVYLFDDDGDALLMGTSGIAPGHAAAPRVLRGGDRDAVWPAGRLFAGEEVVVDGIDRTISDLPTGAWTLPPEKAVLVPIPKPLSPSPYGFLVFGANRHRPVDQSFFEFVELIAAHFSAAITDAQAMEHERERSEALAKLDQAKSDFLANVSHELRTPLTLLLGPAEDALTDERSPLPDTQRRRLEVIARNGGRMLRMVNTLLDFSRLESGQQDSTFERTELFAFTSDLADLFQSATERVGLELVVEGEGVEAWIDRGQWAKVVLNLLSNAFKFTFEGSVTVRVAPGDGSAVVQVIDTGTGIPEDELPHLFERFHRVRGAASRSIEGSGIGLAMVAEVVRLHGGEITVASTLGVGTTFTIALPLGSDHLPADQIRPEEPSDASASAYTGGARPGLVVEALSWIEDSRASEHPVEPEQPAGGETRHATILVVDDNTDMREYVASLLTGNGYHVITAGDGLEALQLLANVRADMVITDAMMPHLDGFGLLAQMRNDAALAAVPVVMLSARAGEDGTIEGLEAGADDYLVKPFSARELLARVRVHLELERAQAVRETVERSRNLLDQAQKIAQLGSWEVDMKRGRITASQTFLDLLEITQDQLDEMDLSDLLRVFLQTDDVTDSVAWMDTAAIGETVSAETTLRLPGDRRRTLTVLAEVAADGLRGGRVVRGSLQDVTALHELQDQLIAAEAARQTTDRERAIADELQHSLLPTVDSHAASLEISTFYRPGEAGTQVGGDWYDVIDLGGSCTAFIVGDVMGRGIRAASVMGQVKAAARAFARLNLQPAEMVENLDGIVQDLVPGGIVTFVYGIHNATTETLTFANAGNLPPLVVSPDGDVTRLRVSGPPLGTGFAGVEAGEVPFPPGSVLALYTDGLVEQRGVDLEQRLTQLEEVLVAHRGEPMVDLPQLLVDALVEDAFDDVALAVMRLHPPDLDLMEIPLQPQLTEVKRARQEVTRLLEDWGAPAAAVLDLQLITSEIVTNALRHGRMPYELRLHRTPAEVVVEVTDASTARPKPRNSPDDVEGGRGLAIIAMLSDRWGVRPSPDGKAVWAARRIDW